MALTHHQVTRGITAQSSVWLQFSLPKTHVVLESLLHECVDLHFYVLFCKILLRGKEKKKQLSVYAWLI